jgi:hypothetical protein
MINPRTFLAMTVYSSTLEKLTVRKFYISTIQNNLQSYL